MPHLVGFASFAFAFSVMYPLHVESLRHLAPHVCGSDPSALAVLVALHRFLPEPYISMRPCDIADPGSHLFAFWFHAQSTLSQRALSAPVQCSQALSRPPWPHNTLVAPARRRIAATRRRPAPEGKLPPGLHSAFSDGPQWQRESAMHCWRVVYMEDALFSQIAETPFIELKQRQCDG